MPTLESSFSSYAAHLRQKLPSIQSRKCVRVACMQVSLEGFHRADLLDRLADPLCIRLYSTSSRETSGSRCCHGQKYRLTAAEASKVIARVFPRHISIYEQQLSVLLFELFRISRRSPHRGPPTSHLTSVYLRTVRTMGRKLRHRRSDNKKTLQ